MKYFVIDSLARSGTTLLSALLRSQEKIVTFDGNFAEARHCNQKFEWPVGYARADIIEHNLIKMSSFDSYKQQILKTLTNKRLNMGLNAEESEELFKGIVDWADVDQLYQRFGERFGSDAIGFRWNQCNFYIDYWCNKSDNHFWITQIRDPRDRIVSNIRTHGWSFKNALEATVAYAKKIDQYRDPNKHIVVYYEDLVSNPVRTLEAITKVLQLNDINITIPAQLTGADNKAYRNQGWRASIAHGDHRVGQEYKGLVSDSIGQHADLLSSSQIQQVNDVMEQFPDVFSRYLEFSDN